MTNEEKNKYLEAVDLVCINCIYNTGDECNSCLVRKSMDYHINNDNDKIVTLAERERASKYAEHILGFAYIPPQDLPMYEKAYKKVSPTR